MLLQPGHLNLYLFVNIYKPSTEQLGFYVPLQHPHTFPEEFSGKTGFSYPPSFQVTMTHFSYVMESLSRQASRDTVQEKTQDTAKDASSMAAVANPSFPGAKLLVAGGSPRKRCLTSCTFLTSLDV